MGGIGSGDAHASRGRVPTGTRRYSAPRIDGTEGGWLTLLPPSASVARVLRTAGLVDELHGQEDVAVSGVTQDSRTVKAGDLFLAWRGSEWDAHDFVAPAARAGAVAAVVERHVPEAGIPQLQVSDGRRAAALAADTILGSPWQDLFTVGITGTNGKTTTALITRHLLEDAGPAVAIGTLGLVEADGVVRAGTEGLTTPGPVQLSQWLGRLVEEGVDSVAVEASSHALEQKRLAGMRFDAAVFTNLSQDHLDYHPDMASYLGAKSLLLDLVKEDGLTVVNAATDHWRSLPLQGRRTLTYGVDSPADLRAEALAPEPHGTRFRIALADEGAEVNLPLLGRFNVENSLAAAGAGDGGGDGSGGHRRTTRNRPAGTGPPRDRSPRPVLHPHRLRSHGRGAAQRFSPLSGP